MDTVGKSARAILLFVTIASCTDGRPSGPDAPDPIAPAPTGVVVSNVLAASTDVNRAAGSANGLTYISASPGTLIDALSLRVRNTTSNGAAVTVPTADGGFDPVAVEAKAGDELTLEISTATSSSVVAVMVPTRQPPRVV